MDRLTSLRATLAARRTSLAVAFGRLVAFLVTSIYMAFPDISKISTRIPGNPGDAFLIFSLVRWGGDRSTSLFSGFWQGPMYASGHNVMAYTDTFLPLAVPYRIVSAVTGSPVVAFNVLYIVGWVLCLECTYLLLVRLTACRSASVVGSLAFTFSTIRLAQTGHYQLMFAFFIPLAFLLLFTLFDKPTIARGIALAFVLGCQFLTTAYYGLVLIVGVAVVAAGLLVARRRRPEARRVLLVLATALAALLVLVGPTALRYSDVQSATTARQAYPASFAMKLGDLRTPAPLTDHLDGISFLTNDSATRSGENYAYVGFFVALLVPAAIAATLLSRRFRAAFTERRGELAAVGVVGLLGLLIAIGKGPILGIHTPFYDLIKSVVPGVKSMLAIVRLFVFSQLALVALATAGLVAAFRLRSSRAVRLGLCAVLSCLVLFESEQGIPTTVVPKVAGSSVFGILQRFDDDGIVAELPAAPRGLGVTYAFLEATRMLLGSGDSLRSVNGYSGFSPEDYDTVVDSLNRFPAADSLSTLQRLGVHYVAIFTAPIDTGLQPVSDLVNGSGYAYMPQAQLDQILHAVPPGVVEQTIAGSDGVVLVLSPT